MLGDEKNENLVALDGLDASKVAVLVIDELGDPTAMPPETGILSAVEQTARILDAARAKDIPVVFTDDAHIPGLDRELELWGPHGLAGTPEAQPCAQLGLCDKDFVIEKRRYSAFFQTGLRLLLDELGVDTLICTGMDTNICVKHTVADAYFNNFKTLVVEDATATFLIGNQADGMAYMKACYASAIVSTDDVIAWMK